MQNINKLFLGTLMVILFSLPASAQGIGIGTTEVDPSAVLEIHSEDGNQGLLIPRIADRTQVDLSDSPKGVMIYDTTEDGFYYYDGTNWLRLVTTPVGIDLDMNSYKITNLSDGVVDGDAVNKSQLDEKANITEVEKKYNNPHEEPWVDLTESNDWDSSGGTATRFQYRIEGDGSIIRFKGSVSGHFATSHTIINASDLSNHFAGGFRFYQGVAIQETASGNIVVPISVDGDNGSIIYEGTSAIGDVDDLFFYCTVIPTTKL